MALADRQSIASLIRWQVTGLVGSYVGVVFVLGGRPEARSAVLLAALCVGAVQAILWALLRSRKIQPPGRASLWTALDWTGFNLSLSLVAGELTLRSVAALSGHSVLLSATLETSRLQPGRDYGHGLRGNQLGYPGADFQRERRSGVYRIAALGDSFAIGPAVPYEDNYLCLLERQAPATEVYNFGVSGTGPREYLAILRQHVWTYQPDLVLVSVFVGNDITETLATPRNLDPRSHYLPVLLARAIRLLREQWRQADPVLIAKDRLEAGAMAPETFDEVEARRLAICCVHSQPGLAKKWQKTLTDLHHIVLDCARHGVPVAFVLIPDEFQVNSEVRERALQKAGIRSIDFDCTFPQRRLMAFFQEQGVRCIDLLPAFASVPDCYAPRDTHWNVKGNRLAAKVIGEWLTEQFPIPDQSGSRPKN